MNHEKKRQEFKCLTDENYLNFKLGKVRDPHMSSIDSIQSVQTSKKLGRDRRQAEEMKETADAYDNQFFIKNKEKFNQAKSLKKLDYYHMKV